MSLADFQVNRRSMFLEELTQRQGLPHAVGLHRIVCYGDYGLYLMGGAAYRGGGSTCSSSSSSSSSASSSASSSITSSRSADDQVYNAQMYKFNITTKRWTKLAPIIPQLTDDHASTIGVKQRRSGNDDRSNIVLVSRCTAFLDRRRLMIAGGRLLNKDFNAASYSTYIYDVHEQTTERLTTRKADDADDEEAATGKTTRLPTNHRDFFDQILLRWRDSYVMCSRVLDEQTGRKRFLFHQLELVKTTADESDSKSSTDIVWIDLSPAMSSETAGGASSTEPLTGDLCELAIYDDFVYCIDKNDLECCLDVQWRYDLRQRKWECVESLADISTTSTSTPSSKRGAMMMTPIAQGKPMDRMFTSCVVYGDSVYVVGGSAMTWAGPKSNAVLGDIWRLHLPTLQWTLVPVRLPEGLWFHSVDVSPSGSMYVFGGFTDLAGRKPTSRLWRVNLNAPPTLSSLAWRSVLNTSDHKLEDREDDELKQMRIPLCYVSALRW